MHIRFLHPLSCISRLLRVRKIGFELMYVRFLGDVGAPLFVQFGSTNKFLAYVRKVLEDFGAPIFFYLGSTKKCF